MVDVRIPLTLSSYLVPSGIIRRPVGLSAPRCMPVRPAPDLWEIMGETLRAAGAQLQVSGATLSVAGPTIFMTSDPRRRCLVGSLDQGPDYNTGLAVAMSLLRGPTGAIGAC